MIVIFRIQKFFMPLLWWDSIILKHLVLLLQCECSACKKWIVTFNSKGSFLCILSLLFSLSLAKLVDGLIKEWIMDLFTSIEYIKYMYIQSHRIWQHIKISTLVFCEIMRNTFFFPTINTHSLVYLHFIVIYIFFKKTQCLITNRHSGLNILSSAEKELASPKIS